MQAVLDVVKESAISFDAVCMATAVHKMASFRKPVAYYKRISQYAPFQELQKLIGEPQLECWKQLEHVRWPAQVLSMRISCAASLWSQGLFPLLLHTHTASGACKLVRRCGCSQDWLLLLI